MKTGERKLGSGPEKGNRVQEPEKENLVPELEKVSLVQTREKANLVPELAKYGQMNQVFVIFGYFDFIKHCTLVWQVAKY